MGVNYRPKYFLTKTKYYWLNLHIMLLREILAVYRQAVWANLEITKSTSLPGEIRILLFIAEKEVSNQTRL